MDADSSGQWVMQMLPLMTTYLWRSGKSWRKCWLPMQNNRARPTRKGWHRGRGEIGQQNFHRISGIVSTEENIERWKTTADWTMNVDSRASQSARRKIVACSLLIFVNQDEFGCG